MRRTASSRSARPLERTIVTSSTLPLKLAITTTDQAGAPTYSAALRWNLAPRLTENAFVFRPPKGAMKIVMQTADGKAVTIK